MRNAGHAAAAIVLLGSFLVTGCHVAPLAAPDAGGGVLDQAGTGRRMPRSRTLDVEVLFLRHEPHDALLGETLWNLVDEQVIDEPTRRRLAANGLRGGVITGGVPSELAARLALAAREPSIEAPGTLRTLQLLPGRRAELVASATRADLIVLENDDDSVRGATYHDASGIFAVRAWPVADGRMRVEAVPEFKHGPARRTWVGDEGAFRLETGQSRHRLERLGITVELPPRGLLVIGCLPDAPSSVGEALLQERSGDPAIRHMLVISPRSAPVDPLFAESSTTASDADGEDEFR